MERKAQYIENPCRTSSIPYWKTVGISVPENMNILHQDDFQVQLLTEYVDEPYFRLKHNLRDVKPAAIPDGFVMDKPVLADFAEHINGCYGGICVTAEELRSYTERAVYCAELWVAVRDKASGKIAATGIGELDHEIGEGVLEWIQVSEEYRGRGLGHFIVRELLWRVKDMARFATVSGQCNNPSNPEKLYRECGFTGNDIWHVMRRIGY